MSKHKAIPKRVRLEVYEKCNHRCAYCGCELEYKDMQVDHIKSIYSNMEYKHTMTEQEMYSIENLLPACRQYNFYKSVFTLEVFRERLQTTMIKNLRKNFGYRLAVKYGLVEEKMKPITFYFEKLRGEKNGSDEYI